MKEDSIVNISVLTPEEMEEKINEAVKQSLKDQGLLKENKYPEWITLEQLGEILQVKSLTTVRKIINENGSIIVSELSGKLVRIQRDSVFAYIQSKTLPQF